MHCAEYLCAPVSVRCFMSVRIVRRAQMYGPRYDCVQVYACVQVIFENVEICDV